ncbi:GNAT family N-acetyltransferase [Nocardia seriolae]|uniref:Aminoglycoside 6'-N-acetyltransferase n=2 Tax=Nocardia seriolae TaxID=37332 RepID=A0A0B8N5M0_9NOCA|nr:GNAT family protein [Nocardia seriolae]APA97194.1 Aminoglycoside 6'-N-acetyltransferase [Nocardia seriolae]MTJ62124.1 GNAT family N-acetyltransferase [Nocardia seriolae]MTJ72319.1 GNAT family N-acetyltransferase [Nocardia seriolae]MTJ87038.1 GNAT family N-acetyltransferase [Nocardia seriolae]MTK31033.1 GNAT family N-acetyltransferase [Nocardia seriolae]
MSGDVRSDERVAAEPDRFQPVPDPRPDDDVWPEMMWPVPGDAVLTGKSVELRPVDPAADAGELFRALDQARTWAHVPGRPQTAAQLEELLRQLNSQDDWHIWTVRTVREVGGESAGAIIGVTAYLDARPRDAGLEIGFTVYTPPVWGTAVNPEAKLLLLEYAFETLNAGRVQLKTDVRNHRSQQAISRLGARYEGTLRRHFRREDGTMRDSVLFSITVEDWPQVRDRLTHRLAELDRAAATPAAG